MIRLERLAEHCTGPAGYGDCARFAADVLVEATGDDLLGEWREADRDRIVARFRTIPRAILWGMRCRPAWQRVQPAETVPPALGLACLEGRSWACCVALGDGWWCARYGDALRVFGAAEVRRAWQPVRAPA